jgi:MYXO-CTERM domain-containing protein
MIQGRSGHSATLLPSGKVLLAGGRADEVSKGRSAELYDPATGRTVATAGSMNAARSGHSATLLPSGLVLLAGGASAIDAQNVNAASSAELYDPATDRFLPLAASLRSPRANHTATLLPGGEVLLAGGTSGVALGPQPNAPELSDPGADGAPWAELYDPRSEAFTATAGGMNEPRSHHTATLLAGGKVLLIGGDDDPDGAIIAGRSAEIYDPASGAFTPTAKPPLRAFGHHTATLLPSGEVLLTGGLARPLPDGGRDASAELREAELYDPLLDRFSATASLADFRADHSATLLPSGRVLLVGGTDTAASTLEVYDPATASFFPAEDLPATRGGGHSATLLATGAVLVAGGSTLVAGAPATSSDTLLYDDSSGGFSHDRKAEVSRVFHTATLLLDGEVLLTGGAASSESSFFPAAELYTPATKQVRPTAGHMHNLRSGHTATLLTSGEVLVAGGTDVSNGIGADPRGALPTAEIYRPGDGSFTLVRAMASARGNHTATLLASGDVLIAGGSAGAGADLQTAELYDPLPRLFFDLPTPMQSPRSSHVAARLRSGEVLLAGGYWGQDAQRSAEIFDPGTRAFRPTGSMLSAHQDGKLAGFTATLLASGRVLIVGFDGAELFDPDADGGTGAFVPAAVDSDAPARRNGHSATLLPSGKVLVAGGVDGDGAPLATSALYDPTSDRFLAPATLTRARAFHTATLLPTAELLITGGFDLDGVVSAYERWDDELPGDRTLPQLGDLPRALDGESAQLSGTAFLGPLETGGGTSSSSATNLPLALWLPVGGGLSTGTLRDINKSSAAWIFPAQRLTGPGLLFLSAGARHGEGVPLVLGQDRACRSSADCAAGQACSSAGVCGDPVTNGPPGEGCNCTVPGAPRGEWPGALGAALLGLAAAARRRATWRQAR